MHRYAHLRNNLRQGLEEATQRAGLDQRGRIAWLVEHLEEYIERWYGFFDLPQTELDSLVKSNGFEVIEFAVQIAFEEIKGDSKEKALQEVCSQSDELIATVRNAKEKRQVPDLRWITRAFHAVLNELPEP